MQGLMMNRPLLITSILRHALQFHPDVGIVSVDGTGEVVHTDYGTAFRRAARFAAALRELGVGEGDRVGTIAWNDHRHLETYYAIPCSGAVCHTINPRLHPEQLVYVVNHADDRVLLVDRLFLPLLERIADAITGVQHVVVLCDAASLPQTTLPNVVSYETLIEAQPDGFDWPDLDENSASSLCYTSGTTGNPKGVLYSHRSTVLHTFAAALPDVMNLSCSDTVLPVVPMFHVNAWSIPYGTAMTGARLVLPGPKMADGETLVRLINGEKVTLAAGVPTIWLAMLQYLDEKGLTLESLERVLIGGAAVPPSMIESFRDRHGVEVHQGWGMTEMSPLGTFNKLKPGMSSLPADERTKIQAAQGRGVFGVELRIVDKNGAELPWDGKSAGHLEVRGPWVCSGYYRSDGGSESHRDDGWFDTGDIATIDADGFMRITDRSKDVIKSGGEWISSVELENVAMGHPDIAEAAVIGIPNEKWTERPLLIVVRKPGADVDGDAIRGYLDGKVATWWIPEEITFTDELPHTATGKVSKRTLRERYAEHYGTVM